MDDNFYKKLIEESQIAYAYHRIIRDKDGIPCDYEFIEVNPAFERLTGLKGTDIVGRKITKVLPSIKKDEFNWIKFYGDIAISGGKKEFEQFSNSLQCWYRVSVHSDEKYYFTTQFVDVTKEKSRIDVMEKLVQISEEFLQMDGQEICYQKISDDFLKICGAKYAVFNLYDEEGKKCTTKAVSGDKGIVKKVSRIIGFDIENKIWESNPLYDKKINTRTTTHFSSLSELLEGILPKPLGTLIEKISNMGEVVLVKITRNNIVLGNFALCMEKGKFFDEDMLVEVYTRGLGMLITRKRAEDHLAREKILTDAIFDSSPGIIYLYNEKGELLRSNKQHDDMTGYSLEELKKINLLDWYKDDSESYNAIVDGYHRALKDGFGDGEIAIPKKDGTTVPMYFTVNKFHLNGEIYFTGVAIDIEERKKKEKEIFYLSYHDQLTGLYNRRFYQEELMRLDAEKNLPITIVMGDVNGLKLINDSFGHAMGDKLLIKVAEVIKSGCREGDIVARLSGDEFVIILLKTNGLETQKIIKRINGLLLNEKVGDIDISISFGYETKDKKQEKIHKIFKRAEDKMYKKKLFFGPTARGKAIKTMIKNLNGKNKMEGEHSNRVSVLCKNMGETLRLTETEIQELKSVGLLHDIGKIAIDGKLIYKSEKFTEDERKEIMRHPEIGYRILNTVPDMADMAKYVLYHHERWDGKGYPKGLKGKQIPLQSRIIAIADAYDAMTSKKSYGSALSEEVAMDELRKNSGTQFEPKLVEIFIKQLIENREQVNVENIYKK